MKKGVRLDEGEVGQGDLNVLGCEPRKFEWSNGFEIELFTSRANEELVRTRVWQPLNSLSIASRLYAWKNIVDLRVVRRFGSLELAA